MTDIALPYDVCPSKVTWTLERNVASEVSPFSRYSQEQGRAGDSWRANMAWDNLTDDKAAQLATYLDQVSKIGNYALVPAIQNDMLGTESGSAAFADLNQPWAINKFSGYSSTNLLTPPYLNNGRAVVFGNATAPATISKSFSVAVGLPYVFSVDVPPSLAVFRVTLQDGTGVLFDSGLNQNAPGRRQVVVYPRTASVTAFFYSGNDTNQFARSLYGDMRLHRAYITQGAQAAGASSSNLSGGIASAPNLAIKANQFFNVQTSTGLELKRLQNGCEMVPGGSINSNSVSHAGRLEFEPALRGALADASPIYHHNPVCRMRLANFASAADIKPPLIHTFSVDFIEKL